MLSELLFCKKRLGLLLAVGATLLCVQPAQAGIEFGIVAGSHLARLDKNHHNGAIDLKNGFIGPKVNLSFLGVGADAAIVYDQRSYKGNEKNSPTYRSIEIPINFRYTLGLSKIAALYFATGPQFGYNFTHNKWTQILPIGDNNKTEHIFNKDNQNISWNIGVGAKLIGHVEVGLTYNFMLSRYAKVVKYDPSSNTTTTDNIRTNTLNLQVAYLF